MRHIGRNDRIDLGERNVTMRRLLAILAAMVLLLAACGGDDDDAEATESGGVEATETEDEASDETTATADDNEAADDAGDDAADAADAGEIDREATLIYATSFITNSLDVPNVGTDFSYTYVNLVYDGLTKRNSAGEVVPAIAESWEVTSDTLILDIVDGRTFHDGTPIDAEAVKANLERIINCECRFASQLAPIGSIETSGNQVILNLSEPAGTLLEVFADIAGMMASPASFENEDLDTNPVGSGPFTVREYSDGGVVYDRWDGYHDVENTLVASVEIRSIPDDNTRISGFISGELDVGLARLGQLGEAEAGGLNIIMGGNAQMYILALETDNEALADPDVRRAISHALDRDGISQGLYGGNCTPTVQPYPEGFPGYVADATVERYAAYDPDLARQLLADAGYPDGFTISMGAPAITNYTNQLEIYQAQLAEIGITVEAIADEGRTFVQRLSEGEYDSWLGPSSTARPSTAAWWHMVYHPDGARNAGGYELPGIDDLLLQLNSATTPAESAAAIEAMTVASLEDGARTIIVCSPQTVAVHQDNVGGYQIGLANNLDLRTVYKTAG